MEKIVYKTVDEYIASHPKEIQEILKKVRTTILSVIPNAVEKISYGMPCYWQGENLVYFAAMKNHIGFYPTSRGVDEFAERLTQYKTSKGAVQFPISEKIPYDLIAEITKFRISQAEDKN